MRLTWSCLKSHRAFTMTGLLLFSSGLRGFRHTMFLDLLTSVWTCLLLSISLSFSFYTNTPTWAKFCEHMVICEVQSHHIQLYKLCVCLFNSTGVSLWDFAAVTSRFLSISARFSRGVFLSQVNFLRIVSWSFFSLVYVSLASLKNYKGITTESAQTHLSLKILVCYNQITEPVCMFTWIFINSVLVTTIYSISSYGPALTLSHDQLF